ncbi:hypothetical protein LguiB_018578 [Lonicera macranthoides]
MRPPGLNPWFGSLKHRKGFRCSICFYVLIIHIGCPSILFLDARGFVQSRQRFDQPEKYKPFVSRYVVQGNLEIGSLREVDVKSGLPATTSTERLELLDDDEHILSVRIVGGDHRLNFRGMLRGSSNGSQWGLDYLY